MSAEPVETLSEKWDREDAARAARGKYLGCPVCRQEVRFSCFHDGIDHQSVELDRPAPGPPVDPFLLAATLARYCSVRGVDPNPGDLVVEVTGRDRDPDALGWLVAHDFAPYADPADPCPGCGGTGKTALAIPPQPSDPPDIRDGRTVKCGTCGGHGTLAEGRDVWDIVPLNPEGMLNPHGVQRWENADFATINPAVTGALGMETPEPVRALIEAAETFSHAD
jgi:hypothetical protein